MRNRTVHTILRPGKRIFLFLDNDWVKSISFIFVVYWLYALFRFAALLRLYDFIMNSSLRELWRRLSFSRIVPYAVLFLVLGQILGIILNNRLIAKSIFVGFIVSVLIYLNFPLFFTVALNPRGFLTIDSLYPCLVFPFGTIIARAYRNSIVKRKGLRNGLLGVMIAVFVFSSARQTVILYRLHFSKSVIETRYKADADMFSRLLDSLVITEKNREIILNDSEKYDVSRFFNTLTHLRMEPGYTLDYVYYHDDFYGFPVLYARRSEDAAFINYGGFRQVRGEISEDEYWDRIYGRSRMESDKNISGYLDHVMIDDEPEGYFQHVLLRIMGSQFYLWWHSGYNAQRPVFNYRQLREIMSKEKDEIERLNAREPELSPWSWQAFDPWILIRKAAELNFEPSIIIGKEDVEIKVVIFTNYGGLIQRYFVISRAFPHRLLRDNQNILVPYFCGRVF